MRKIDVEAEIRNVWAYGYEMLQKIPDFRWVKVIVIIIISYRIKTSDSDKQSGLNKRFEEIYCSFRSVQVSLTNSIYHWEKHSEWDENFFFIFLRFWHTLFFTKFVGFRIQKIKFDQNSKEKKWIRMETYIPS